MGTLPLVVVVLVETQLEVVAENVDVVVEDVEDDGPTREASGVFAVIAVRRLPLVQPIRPTAKPSPQANDIPTFLNILPILTLFRMRDQGPVAANELSSEC